MRINAFGTTVGKLVSVKEYEFCVKGKHGNSFYLKEFAVPVICAPIVNQKVNVVMSQFEQLSDHITSDTISNDGKIDILVVINNGRYHQIK